MNACEALLQVVREALLATAELFGGAAIVDGRAVVGDAAVAAGGAEGAGGFFERDACLAAADGFVACAAGGRVWVHAWAAAPGDSLAGAPIDPDLIVQASGAAAELAIRAAIVCMRGTRVGVAMVPSAAHASIGRSAGGGLGVMIDRCGAFEF